MPVPRFQVNAPPFASVLDPLNGWPKLGNADNAGDEKATVGASRLAALVLVTAGEAADALRKEKGGVVVAAWLAALLREPNAAGPDAEPGTA
jgi:hypothetical protein